MKNKALELFNILLGEYDEAKISDRHTLQDIENFFKKEFFTADDMANSLNEYTGGKDE